MHRGNARAVAFAFYTPKSDTKGRSEYGVYRVRKAGVYLPFIKRYIEIETRGRSASCAARPEGAGEGSRPQGASMRSQRLAGILDRRAAWIYSPARASPRKRIDRDCARGSRHCPAICDRSGWAIWKRARSAPPAVPPAKGGERVPAQKIKTAPEKGCGSKNGFLIFGENWGTKKYA